MISLNCTIALYSNAFPGMTRMANGEHVNVVLRGATEISRFRDAHPGLSLDLSDADLHDARLEASDLRGSDLRGANLAGTDLRNTNLSECRMQGANLRRAHLQNATMLGAAMTDSVLHGVEFAGADLRCAILFGADLYRANLQDAILRRANMRYANLQGATMSASDLRNADLFNANLANAILINANAEEAVFNGAILNGSSLDHARLSSCSFGSTYFANCDLSLTIGLEQAEHMAPSSIGIDTIYKSKGQIPEVFLRGCGVADSMITYMKSLTVSPIEFYSCFISHNHEDKAFARRLHDTLQGRGIRCWLDEHQLLPGDDIYEGIDRGIKNWDKLILCGSENSLTSWWVDDELNRAFEKEQSLMRLRERKVNVLVPLNLDGYMFEGWESAKSSEVKTRMIGDFTGWESDNSKFEREVERLIKALQTDDSGREPLPKPKI